MLKNRLLAIFIVLWIMDCIATIVFVSQHGITAEANPLMRITIDHGGMFGFMAVKAIVLIPLIGLHKHIRSWIYAGLIAIMIPVVYMGMHMAMIV